MGTPSSKIGENVGDDELSEGSIPSTPIITPKVRTLEKDPRSPTTNIARTPIEVLKTPHGTMQNNSGETNSNMLELDTDPRSPTVEFTRTPIIINTTNASQPNQLRNKHLDKARQPVFHLTPIKTKFIAEQVQTDCVNTTGIMVNKAVIPPKLLESSPISPKPKMCNKRHSTVGLLETNIDFVETDLDTVVQAQVPDMCRSIELMPITSSYDESKSSPAKSDEETEMNVPVEGSSVIDVFQEMATNLLECENTMCTEPENESNSTLQVNLDEYTIDHNHATSSIDDKAAEAQAPKIFRLSKIFNSENNSEQTKPSNGTVDITTPSVDEFDKKLTHLIYEDTDLQLTPQPFKKVEKVRTPLGVRNSINEPKRAIPKLRVSDRPTKPHYTVSKIPVFKDKKVRGKLNIQCENTPPRNTDGVGTAKSKRPNWGAEDSLII